MEILQSQQESFEIAKENVIKELINEYNKTIADINSLQIKICEIYLKNKINYDDSTDYDESCDSTDTSIGELFTELKRITKYIEDTQDIKDMQ